MAGRRPPVFREHGPELVDRHAKLGRERLSVLRALRCAWRTVCRGVTDLAESGAYALDRQVEIVRDLLERQPMAPRMARSAFVAGSGRQLLLRWLICPIQGQGGGIEEG